MKDGHDQRHGDTASQVPPGIISDPEVNRSVHQHNFVSIFVSLLGSCLAIASLPILTPTWVTLANFVIFLLLTSIGIELGLHRYFTHKAFRCGTAARTILAVLGTWAFQGPISRWVADHRRHHRYTDQPFDTHSPYWIAKTPTGGVKGFIFAHFSWMLRGNATSERHYARDILSDPISRFVSQHYWLVASTGLVAPALLGWMAVEDREGAAEEAIRCLLWAGFFRVTLLHQFTWAVNSFGHRFGKKHADNTNASRDNVGLAILTLGGGLHAYHHRYANSAINRPAYLDPVGWLVLLLERTGIIWSVRRNPE